VFLDADVVFCGGYVVVAPTEVAHCGGDTCSDRYLVCIVLYCME
jgi:hypothetical protein